MNLNQLQLTLARNRVPLLAAGAAGVAGFALYKKQQGASTKTVAVPTEASISSSGVPTSQTAGYDSTGSDVYNALQPALEDINDGLNQLLEQNKPTPVPVPKAPTPPKKTPPKKTPPKSPKPKPKPRKPTPRPKSPPKAPPKPKSPLPKPAPRPAPKRRR